MKFSDCLLTLWIAGMFGALVGCAEPARPITSSLSQKTAVYQTPSSQNPVAGQRDTPPHLETVSTSPVVVSPPIPVMQTEKVKAAILLPLSGKNASLGQAMLNAAQQAVFDAAGTNFELQPHDTAAEGGAEEATRAAVTGGVSIIIGPLFATDVPLVLPIARLSGIEILALSTDTSLAQPGLYIMGLAPGTQVERIVTFAASHNAHNFAALVPATPYGTLVSEVFRTSVAQLKSATLVDVETYSSASEIADKVRTLAAQKDHIDALFLPESGADLKSIADQLTATGFDPTHTHILGTGLWDVPGLGKQSPFLVGGWYAAPDPSVRRNFIASYTAAYGQEPPRLATLAYDATALAAVIAKHGGRYDQAALTNPNGFAGLDGIFRLLPSGEVERALAVDQVTLDGSRLIDAAPTTFMGKR